MLFAEDVEAVVKSGEYLKSSITKTRRDIDITVRTNILAGYEVKQYKKPVSTPDVESLFGKLQGYQDILTSGIISGSGYSKTALRACEAFSLKALTLRSGDHSEEFYWNIGLPAVMAGQLGHWKWIEGPHLKFLGPDTGGLQLIPGMKYKIIPPKGRYLGISSLDELVKIVTQVNLSDFGKHQQIGNRIEVRVDDENFEGMRIFIENQVVEINRLVINGVVEFSEDSVPSERYELFDELVGKPIVHGAVSVWPTGDLSVIGSAYGSSLMKWGIVRQSARNRERVFNLVITNQSEASESVEDE